MIQEVNLQRSYVVLLLLLLLGYGLRVYRIDTQELRGDEAFSWNYVAHESGPISLAKRIVSEGDPQPPLHYLMLQNWVRIFGDREWAMRIPSAFLSLMLIPLVYQFAARAITHSVGLITAAITTLHPFQIWLAQDVRNMYQLALGFGLAGTLLLPAMLQGKRAHWFGYVLLGALAMYSHYYALFGLLAHGTFALSSARGQLGTKAIMRWLAAGFATAILLLPWAIVIVPVYAKGQLADPAHMAVGEYLVRTGSSVALGPTIASSIGLPAAGAALILVVVGAASAQRGRRQRWASLLISWTLIALVGIYVVISRRATFNTFYFLVAFPAVYTLLASGCLTLMGMKPAGKLVVGIASIIAMGGFWLSLSNYYFNPDWSKNRGLREITAILDAELRRGDLYIPNFPDPAQDYYLRGLALPRHMLPSHPGASRVDISEALTTLTQQFDRLWFVPIYSVHWDHAQTTRSLLNQHFLLERAYNVHKLELLRYVSDPTSALGYRSLGASFGNGLEMIGAHIAANGLPAGRHLDTGDQIRVSLLWESLGSVDSDYTIFVHALDANGRLTAQHDGVPQSGARPTSTWAEGESILDVHEFQLPETIETKLVTLSVGMYLPHSGDRLRWEDGADHIKVAEFEVVD